MITFEAVLLPCQLNFARNLLNFSQIIHFNQNRHSLVLHNRNFLRSGLFFISSLCHFRQNCYFLRDPFCHDFFFPSFIPLLYKSFYLHSTASHVCSILHVAVRYVNPRNLKITQKRYYCELQTANYTLQSVDRKLR